MEHSSSQLAFLKELQDVVICLRAELHQRQLGVPGPGSTHELQAMIVELAGIERQAMSQSLPPAHQRWMVASRTVIDTWPDDGELGDRVCKLAELYRKVL